ncbi:MAG: hypothetical protein J6Q82_06220 [Clostridia bacterium]|nr:hypothetical protein [Clostridia bacterium]
MNKNLLIVGAGTYSLVAKEIAESMCCFDKIQFVDDQATVASDGSAVFGKIDDIKRLSSDFSSVVVAIGNPDTRMRLLQKLELEPTIQIVTLVSPYAYISSSAKIGKGCIIEPKAVVHTGCVLGKGCFISAGAVINHISTLGDGVHVDCNATVAGYMNVLPGTKVECGMVFQPPKG